MSGGAIESLEEEACTGMNDADNMGAVGSPDGGRYWLMTACYVPLLAWGPLLAVVTVAYYRRRGRCARPSAGSGTQDGAGASPMLVQSAGEVAVRRPGGVRFGLSLTP